MSPLTLAMCETSWESQSWKDETRRLHRERNKSVVVFRQVDLVRLVMAKERVGE